ncbi:hypothetical protein [Nostoc sp. CMAA1605]|uniref:hypothetical protein n=1 Tax=Nostoc sp. CMAA1605 TaxID=2055159 RepID=UPI001F2892C7|nr:hypothetical protein [Nostoc sp. CMAA1605]
MGIGDWGLGIGYWVLGTGKAGEEKLQSLLITHYSLLITHYSLLSTPLSPFPDL